MIAEPTTRRPRYSRPTSEFRVHPLDLSPMADFLNKAYIERYPEEANQEGLMAYDTRSLHGMVETPKGWVLVEDEGIINIGPSTVLAPLKIDLYAKFKGSFSMVPWTTLSLPPDKFIPLLSKETVTLDQFIRVFGSRLESNFAIAEEHLTKLNKPNSKNKA